MVVVNDPVDMAEKIIHLFESGTLRNKIISEGLRTASQYTWDSIIPQIIEYYRQIASSIPIKSNK